MLTMYVFDLENCWSEHFSTILLTLASKASLKKLRKLKDTSLSLRREPWRFQFDWGVWTTAAGINLSADIDWNRQRAATTGQKKYEDSCLLSEDLEGGREGDVFVSSELSAWFLPVIFATCTAGHWRWWSSLKRKCLPYKRSFFVISYFCKVFKNMNISFLHGQNRLNLILNVSIPLCLYWCI
jgi:hypothetical protein